MKKILPLIFILSSWNFANSQVGMRFIKRGEPEKAIAIADRKSRSWVLSPEVQSKIGDLEAAPSFYDLQDVAETYYYVGYYKKAKDLFEFVLPVYKKKYPADKAPYNKALVKLAESCIQTGDYIRAREIAGILVQNADLSPLSVEALLKEGVRFDEVVNIYQQLGMHKEVNGLLDKSLAEYLRYIQPGKMTDGGVVLWMTPAIYAVVQYSQRLSEGILYCIETAQFQRAEALIARLSAICELKFSPDDIGYYAGMEKQGEFCLATGRHEEALAIYTTMKQRVDSADKGGKFRYGWVQYRLGKAYMGLHRYSEAEEHLQAALAIGDKME